MWNFSMTNFSDGKVKRSIKREASSLFYVYNLVIKNQVKIETDKYLVFHFAVTTSKNAISIQIS